MGSVRIRTVVLTTGMGNLEIIRPNRDRTHLKIQSLSTTIDIYVAAGGKPGRVGDAYTLLGTAVPQKVEFDHKDTPDKKDNPAALGYVIWSASGTPSVTIKEVFE